MIKDKIRKKYAIESQEGIDVMEKVKIGGLWQYLYIRGENKNNPILLYLHGGPGSSMMPFITLFQKEWEKDFTVVQWDQRNAGKTYRANDPKKVAPTVTVTQMLADTLEVVRYLTNKYGKEKVVLLGHSWGSVLGSLFIKKYPEYVDYYIGVGQVINFKENETVGFKKALERATEANNIKDIKALKALEPYPSSKYKAEEMNKMMKLRKIQQKYHLAAGPNFKLGCAIFTSPYTTFKEGMSLLSNPVDLYPKIFKYLFGEYDLKKRTPIYKVPIIYIMGEDDWQTPYTLAKSYFETIQAPYKEFITIKNAGHIAMIDQPQAFAKALVKTKKRG